MKLEFFRLAEKVSKLSTHRSHKLGAVLTHKNRVVSFGANHLKTNPHSPHPHKSIHAEFHAILNSKLKNFKNCEIYVYRQTPGGRLGNSRPCKYCFKLLAEKGISAIYYTTDNNNYAAEYL